MAPKPWSLSMLEWDLDDLGGFGEDRVEFTISIGLT